MSLKSLSVLLVANFVVAHQLYAQLPTNFFEELFLEELERPVGIKFDPSGQGYIIERSGQILVLNDEGELLSEPLIDISDEVLDWKDHGLLGFALDPNYLQNGYFYLLYVVDRHHLLHYGTAAYDPNKTIENEATIGRITRYTADANTNFSSTLPNSRKVLLGKDASDGFPILMISHGIGTLAFGDDGTLLASSGDGGAFQEADRGSSEYTFYEQALKDGILRPAENIGSVRSLLVNSLSGKIIRIDPETGDGLPSNPYYDAQQPRAAKSRVWASGFRNPFRFIVEEGSGGHFAAEGNPGKIYVGDVGGSHWEELNIITEGGMCFGWPYYEALTLKWEYELYKMENLDAPNLLAPSISCDKAHFTFEDLFQHPQAIGDPKFLNPCDTNFLIPDTIHSLIHSLPAIAWNNSLWNKPIRTITIDFDSTQQLAEFQLTDNQGDPFDGYSSIPGVYYQEGNFPEKYKNALFSSDLIGWIRAFWFDENDKLIKVEPFNKMEKGITDLVINPKDGCLYYVQNYDGEIYRICYDGNPAPIVQVETDKQYGASPLKVEFDASASYAPKGYALSYHWDFGDGQIDSGKVVSHIFEVASTLPKQFDVTLTITDSVGMENTEDLIISVNNTPPLVEITSFDDGDKYGQNGITILPLEAKVTDKEHTSEELDYEWQVFFHHNDHYHAEQPLSIENTTTIVNPTGCGGEEYWYRVRLLVTDEQGLQGIDERSIYPYCGEPFFTISALQADVKEKYIDLIWEVEEEIEVRQYELQRTSSYEYETIATIEANSLDNYNYTDTNPIKGENIYRLKVVDAQGNYDYSEAVQVTFPPKPAYQLFPNPARTFISITIEEVQSEWISLNFYDVTGRKVYSNGWEGTTNVPTSANLSIAHLPSGVYYYEIENGDLTYRGKLLLVE